MFHIHDADRTRNGVESGNGLETDNGRQQREYALRDDLRRARAEVLVEGPEKVLAAPPATPPPNEGETQVNRDERHVPSFRQRLRRAIDGLLGFEPELSDSQMGSNRHIAIVRVRRRTAYDQPFDERQPYVVITRLSRRVAAAVAISLNSRGKRRNTWNCLFELGDRNWGVLQVPVPEDWAPESPSDFPPDVEVYRDAIRLCRMRNRGIGSAVHSAVDWYVVIHRLPPEAATSCPSCGRTNV